MVGRFLAHYEILESLGAGGMGEVYRAYDAKLKREVALKVLAPELAANPLRRQRFEREARAVAALDHPNIVTVYSFDVADDGDGRPTPFITMQLVQGETLREALRRGALPLSRFFDIAIALADGLAAAHDQGIIHRDLKPGNVMIDRQGTPRILDFGLAKLRDAESDSEPDTDGEASTDELPTELTHEKQVLGTVGYMSPEQVQGQPVDHRSDIFSLGVMLHEMAAGERPFKGENTASIIASIIRDQPVSLSELKPGLPRHLGRIIRHALKKDPERRFQSAKDLRNELVELRNEITSGELSLDRAASVPRSRPPLIWIAPIALALALAGFFLVYFRAPESSSGPLRVTPLTTLEGSELDPAVSPSGDHLAFVWDGEQEESFDLYVQLTGTGEPLRLTSSTLDDRYPAWSPDGREIAFLRSSRSMGYEILAVPALGGAERRLGSIRNVGFPGLDWSPDGRTLAVVQRGQAGVSESIFLLDVATGESERLTEPPSGSLGDKCPSFSPDGRTLAFVRWFEAPRSEVWTIPVSGGEPKRVLEYRGFVRGLDWLADGSGMVLATWSADSPGLWRLGRSGALTQLLVAEDAWGVSVAGAGRLIYSKRLSRSNIWRVSGPAARRPSPPHRLIASTRDDWAPQYSPDGTRIAFTSDRTGAPQIWICDAEGGNCARKATEGPTIMTRWSPDSRRLSFAVENSGNTDVYVAEAADFFPHRLTSHESVEATSGWSLDGRWIYFFTDRTGQYEVWRVSVDGEKTEQLTTQGGVLPQESSYDGLVYYIKTTDPWSIWRKPAAGGEERLVMQKMGLGRSGFTLWRNLIVYFLRMDGRRHLIESFNLETGQSQVVVELDSNTRLGKYGRLTVSPDGLWILYPQREGSGSDLILMDGLP